MPARWRKLIGGIGILVFLAIYVKIAVTVFGFVPRWWWLQLVYMAVVGMAWGLPIIPLISWMNRGR